LKLKQDQILYITAPYQYKDRVLSIIESKSKWIYNHLALMSQQFHLVSEDSLFLLGVQYAIKLEQTKNNKQSYSFENKKLILTLKDETKKSLFLDQVLKMETNHYLRSILPYWIKQTGLIPKSHTVRKMKIWGSCTRKGNLQFNSYLVCLPPALIEYIVCHELVHLQQFDHSKKFYQLLANFLPNVKKLEKDLKMFVR
jgi:predicted metal-dependent hydrolase